MARMQAVAGAEDDPVLSLKAAALVSVPGIDDPETTANHLAQLGVDLADPELRPMLAGLRADYRNQLRLLLEKADLPGAPPPEQAARILGGLVHGLQVDWALSPVGGMLEMIGSDVDRLLTVWRKPPS